MWRSSIFQVLNVDPDTWYNNSTIAADVKKTNKSFSIIFMRISVADNWTASDYYDAFFMI